MGMIGLAANSGPFFMRVNPNAAVFTPHFNKIGDWNFGRFNPHPYLLVSFSACGCTFAWLLATEMKRVSQVLQFAIVIQRSGPPPILETQLFQKLDFLWGRISVQRTIFQEFL